MLRPNSHFFNNIACAMERQHEHSSNALGRMLSTIDNDIGEMMTEDHVMIRWIKAFIQDHLVQDVPPELAFCEFDCRKLGCTVGYAETCTRHVAAPCPDLPSYWKLVAEKDTGIIYNFNKSFERVIGFSKQEAIGRSSLELGLWDDPEDRKQLLAKLENGKRVVDFESRFCSKQGHVLQALAESVAQQIPAFRKDFGHGCLNESLQAIFFDGGHDGNLWEESEQVNRADKQAVS